MIIFLRTLFRGRLIKIRRLRHKRRLVKFGLKHNTAIKFSLDCDVKKLFCKYGSKPLVRLLPLNTNEIWICVHHHIAFLSWLFFIIRYKNLNGVPKWVVWVLEINLQRCDLIENFNFQIDVDILNNSERVPHIILYFYDKLILR